MSNKVNVTVTPCDVVVSVIQLPIVLPAVLCIISGLIVLLTFYQKPSESFLALGLVAGGTVLYCITPYLPKTITSKMGEWLSYKLFLAIIRYFANIQQNSF